MTRRGGHLHVEALEDRRMLAVTIGDLVPPTATLFAADVFTAGDGFHEFTVSYADNIGIDTTTLDSTDLRVTGPRWPTVSSDFQLATFVRLDEFVLGQPRVVTYRVAAPGGSWDAADTGTYTVRMESGQVRDLLGNPVAAGPLGSFQVNVGGTAPSVDRIGSFDSSTASWQLDANGDGVFDTSDGPAVTFGFGGAIAVAGDWNGDGLDDLGVYSNGAWFRDLNGDGVFNEPAITFGFAGALPVVGDWNGDGIDDVGVFNGGAWFRDLNGNALWDSVDSSNIAFLGWDVAVPAVGDWNGDGIDDLGVYSLGGWFRDIDGNGLWNTTDVNAVAFYGWDGAPNPVPGDWNGDGVDDFGVFSQGFWFRDLNANGLWESFDSGNIVNLGSASTQPVVGQWNPAGSALVAATGEGPAGSGLSILTGAEVQPVLAQAIADWTPLVSSEAAARLADIRVVITDLPGARLGWAELDTIYLDRDAAGHGWFIDPTPAADEEFERIGSGAALRAADLAAAERMDLLTVVSHELGHVAGFDDLDALAESLMSGALERGVRYRPDAAAADAVFARFSD